MLESGRFIPKRPCIPPYQLLGDMTPSVYQVLESTLWHSPRYSRNASHHVHRTDKHTRLLLLKQQTKHATQYSDAERSAELGSIYTKLGTRSREKKVPSEPSVPSTTESPRAARSRKVRGQAGGKLLASADSGSASDGTEESQQNHRITGQPRITVLGIHSPVTGVFVRCAGCPIVCIRAAFTRCPRGRRVAAGWADVV